MALKAVDAVKVGTRVVGYDGVEIGHVLEGDRERLKVRCKDQTDLWVTGRAILSADRDRVTLICYARGVHRWGVEHQV